MALSDIEHTVAVRLSEAAGGGQKIGREVPAQVVDKGRASRARTGPSSRSTSRTPPPSRSATRPGS
ncbi:hypothetical protein [Tessaracoccus defluvii]|uniref:hypothetical protein n=1 Tax=Tessaracoccus defluvii TaxID=1285901 RepID=UPI003873C252